MTIDESLARGLSKRRHRELKEKIKSLHGSTRQRKGAALKQTKREMRRVFGDMILQELVAGQKKQTSITWILLYPVENGQYSVVGGFANWKQLVPEFCNLMVLSLHAMQRLKQKEVDLRIELATAMQSLFSKCAEANEHTELSSKDFLEVCGSKGYELYTKTGRLPLIWSDDDELLAVTWIADSWSSPAGQEIIESEREENRTFSTRSIDAD